MRTDKKGRRKGKKYPRHQMLTSFGEGWTVYILCCADGSFATGMTRNLRRTLAEIQLMKGGRYFKNHPERLPVTVAYQEVGLPFRQAYAKHTYLTELPRRLRLRLIATGRWPLGGALKTYIETAPFEEIFGYW
jgi:predicted GIY-YIG superfamily endonuclease